MSQTQAGLGGGGGGAQHGETAFIAAPTYRDVLNGRGQGVQRHPGNVKYRALVYVNKVRQQYLPMTCQYPSSSLADWTLLFRRVTLSNSLFTHTGTLCQVPKER